MNITDEQLVEWERMANSATPGPWFGKQEHWPDFVKDCVFNPDKDWVFVKNAREMVPALIAEVRRLWAEMDAYHDEVHGRPARNR